MNSLVIDRFFELEAFKEDILQHTKSAYKYTEKHENNLTILEFVNLSGKVIKEVILVSPAFYQTKQ